MLLLDDNVLIYAFRRDLPQHTTAKRWLERKLSADEPLELLVLSELAFLRITTNRRAFAQPSRFEEALRFLDALRSCPIVSELHPGPEHRSIFVRVARDYHLTGNDLSDAFSISKCGLSASRRALHRAKRIVRTSGYHYAALPARAGKQSISLVAPRSPE